ncbi:hypothetical protein NDU88_010544 [Pleurodeles waltl]|uniref:Uncharacterized protein n=1 Tax=Pleurodeles waltl TaxID=8319 RepID=A0AAV7R0I1_PLEWA|nr:hypothetical protein NDU88_010544 [Pleurodeles waltl]
MMELRLRNRSFLFNHQVYQQIRETAMACCLCLPDRGSRRLQRPPTLPWSESSLLRSLSDTVAIFSGGERLLVGERLRQGGTGNRKKEEPAAAPIEANESL